MRKDTAILGVRTVTACAQKTERLKRLRISEEVVNTRKKDFPSSPTEKFFSEYLT